MFEPNAYMSVKHCPEVKIPVKVFCHRGIKGESWWDIHTEEAWDEAMGGAYHLFFKWNQPKELWRRIPGGGGLVKEPKAAAKNLVIEFFAK